MLQDGRKPISLAWVLPSLVQLLSVVPITLLDMATKANKLPLAREWRAAADKRDHMLGRE